MKDQLTTSITLTVCATWQSAVKINQEGDNRVMEQLAAALTELARFQQEQQCRLEESQRQQEEQ